MSSLALDIPTGTSTTMTFRRATSTPGALGFSGCVEGGAEGLIATGRVAADSEAGRQPAPADRIAIAAAHAMTRLKRSSSIMPHANESAGDVSTKAKRAIGATA
jgi:hypothetical protein